MAANARLCQLRQRDSDILSKDVVSSHRQWSYSQYPPAHVYIGVRVQSKWEMFISTFTQCVFYLKAILNSLSWPQGCQTALIAPWTVWVSQLDKRKKTAYKEDRAIMIPETNLKPIPLNSTRAAEERCSRAQIISEPVGITRIIYAHHVSRWIFLFNAPPLLQITCSSPGWGSNCISWYLNASYYSFCLWLLFLWQ